MEALAERLSQLDSQAEGALRVVMFYDTLMRRRVDLPALVRASAALAECVAGIRLHGTGRAIRVGPDGRQASAPPSPASTTAPKRGGLVRTLSPAPNEHERPGHRECVQTG
jgi:hypothetical protein